MSTMPRGRVLELQRTTVESQQTAQVPDTKGPQPEMGKPALLVTIRAPDGEIYEHYLPNGGWSVANPALQFIARCGLTPSDVPCDIRYQDLQVPLAIDKEQNYHIHQKALEQGAMSLEESTWMETPSDEETEEADAQRVEGDVVDIVPGGHDDG